MRFRGVKRQKNQLELAFVPMGQGEASPLGKGGTETPRAAHACQGPASTDLRMEEICDPANLKRALQRVCANHGAPGVDGMTVKTLPGYLGDHWCRRPRCFVTAARSFSRIERGRVDSPSQ
jgi:hypothetical protein